MRRRWYALAVILTAPSACDNVNWGGVDLHLEPPPPVGAAADTSAAGGATPGPPVLERLAKAVLLAGTREGNVATLSVVGIAEGDSLTPVPSEETPAFQEWLARQLGPGTDLVLFAEGVRVGRLTVTLTGLDETLCVPRPTVTGVVELTPMAGEADTQNLLALLDTTASKRSHGDFRVLEHDYGQRLMTINAASETLRQVGAPFPPALVDARADIQAFQLPDQPGPSVAATFLHQDRLGTGPPLGEAAYALFVMGTRVGEVHQPSYVWYRKVIEEGKGAPRYFAHLDWNGDGVSEILLEVFGADRRWFAGLARRGDSWVRTFQDACRPAG
jgi:hypothetical protein